MKNRKKLLVLLMCTCIALCISSVSTCSRAQKHTGTHQQYKQFFSVFHNLLPFIKYSLTLLSFPFFNIL